MIIGISGKMGSGKDTFGSMLKEVDSDYELKSFAGKLKKIASMISGIPVENFEDQEFKTGYMSREWDTVKMVDSPSKYLHEERTPMTVREFLQKLGTDGLKDGLHQNVWINALFSDYITQKCDDYGNCLCGSGTFLDGTKGSALCEGLPNWVITDVRFPEEAEAIQKRGGVVVRLIRPDNEVGVSKQHRSETAMDDFRKFNLVIMNDGGLNDLKKDAEKVLRMIKKDMYCKF